MQIGFLRELLDFAEAYELGGGSTDQLDLEDFAGWLLAHQRQPMARTVAESVFSQPVNGLIAMHLSFMGRYAQFYGRRVFRHSAVYSQDDWGVLVTLYPDQQMKKTDLIRDIVMEKSSGNEVLKRMLKQRLLHEHPHPTDKRSKLIQLTAAGRAAFESVQNGIGKLAETVVADLTAEEKENLLHTLIKLHRYHKPIFEAADEAVLGRMLGSGA